MCQLRLVGGSKIFVMVTPKRVEMIEFPHKFLHKRLETKTQAWLPAIAGELCVTLKLAVTEEMFCLNPIVVWDLCSCCGRVTVPALFRCHGFFLNASADTSGGRGPARRRF